jgi:small subunit ribosomal protein S1
VADFTVGDVIDGTVTKLVNFGAFVRVRDGLEGLIHISELSHQRVAHPGDVVHEGQTLKLKIISLDSERHRLGLSLKQAEEPPARPPMPEAPVQAASSAPRPERRPRPERGYSMADAVQEPEGGIDNTLASAFAQIRAQVAESEAKATVEPEAPAPAETTMPAVEPEIEAAPAETESAPAEAPAPAETNAPAVEPEVAPAEAPAPAKPKAVRAPKAPKAEAKAEASPAEAEAEAAPAASVEATAEVPAEEPEA